MDIKQNELYPENSPFVDSLLSDMATQPILHVGKFCQHKREATVIFFVRVPFVFAQHKLSSN